MIVKDERGKEIGRIDMHTYEEEAIAQEWCNVHGYIMENPFNYTAQSRKYWEWYGELPLINMECVEMSEEEDE
jgi:hypothetical protein